MGWNPAVIEQAFGLNQGDVFLVRGDTVECAPSVPPETVAEINRVVQCEAPPDMVAWGLMREKVKQGKVAFDSWAILTSAQKDTVLKNLLGYNLYQEKML